MIVVVPENSIQRMRALRPDRAQSRCLLVLLTATAVIVLPIQTGVAIGIGSALVHGVFMTTRTRPVELQKLPGTTVWWPTGGSEEGANQEGVAVIAFQAPLLFANAPTFKRSMIEMIDRYEKQPGLVVLEASGIADIDFTAARALMDVIQHCRAVNIRFAIARLEIRASAEGDGPVRHSGRPRSGLPLSQRR